MGIPMTSDDEITGMGCVHEGCSRPVKVRIRRLCNIHYLRLQRRGPLPPIDRFWTRSTLDSSGCRIWNGRLDKGGYGIFSARGAHRVAYEMAIGPIPDGMTIDHRCRVRSCIIPDQLRVLASYENLCT